jgi:hypothetical protein
MTPGEDAKGSALRQRAEAVLTALNRYIRANGKAPATVQALVPVYIAALPAQPELNYSVSRGTLLFSYAAEWPVGSINACQARFGETEFRCERYR